MENFGIVDLNGILVIHLYTKIEKTDNISRPKAYNFLTQGHFSIFIIP
jgi:hypothetical protein